nr:23S rRNA (uracil(1939)-C(5))-methyltransferase RlmD [Tissierella sp.]
MAKKAKIVEIKINESIFPNKSVGEYNDQKVIFKGGIKGQVVNVRLKKKKEGYIEGKLMEVVTNSSLEKNLGKYGEHDLGPCPYGTLLYEDELELKEEQILNLFKKHEIEGFEFLGIERSPREFAYRNKMEYTFGDEFKGGPIVLGLHKKGRFYEIVDTDGCDLVDEDFTKVRKTVMKYFRKIESSFYNKRAHKGFLRHCVVRKALTTGEILVNLVTSSQDTLKSEEFVRELLAIKDLQGDISGILHTINDGLGDTVSADKLDLLYGRDYIIEEILGLKFNISPFSFFQTNTWGAEKLYSIVREFVGDEKKDIVFDLYSGTGTIAQIISPIAKEVIGIEIVEEAVVKARENMKLNNLENIEFIAEDVLKAIDKIDKKPDLIIIDPPRDGIHPKAIDKIIDFNPDRFVYVSCNPVTLVRDLKVFKERGYTLKKLKIMDMFPRTPHVEVVTLLVKE